MLEYFFHQTLSTPTQKVANTITEHRKVVLQESYIKSFEKNENRRDVKKYFYFMFF